MDRLPDHLRLWLGSRHASTGACGTDIAAKEGYVDVRESDFVWTLLGPAVSVAVGE